MSLVPARYRPYLAGLLGTVATGFGHLYLRRWLRGLGWIALAFAVTFAFVPEAALETMAAGETLTSQSEFYPPLIVQLAAALDAFLLAYRNDSGDDDGVAAHEPTAADTETGTVSCPNCGKEVDAELGFCHWCTTEFVTDGN
jgi:hypothetical protein